MSATFGPLKDFTFVGVELVQGMEPNTHRYSIVVMSHASSAQVACNQLDLHL